MSKRNVMTTAPAAKAAEYQELHQQVAAANAAMEAIEMKLQQGGVVVSPEQQMMMSQFRAAVEAQLELASRFNGG